MPDLALNAAAILDLSGYGATDSQARVRTPGCACGASTPISVRLFLKSRTRPVFESHWTCGSACLRTVVHAAVMREWNSGARRREHRHRVPLGLVLLSAGLITQAELRSALETQRSTGLRIGDILAEHMGISEAELASALSIQWACPVWSLGSLRPDVLARIAPRELLERAGSLPLRIDGDGRISIAFVESVDSQMSFAVQRIHAAPVDCGILPAGSFRTALDRVFAEPPLPCVTQRCEDIHAVEREVLRLVRRHSPVESRLARVHNLFWLRLWLEEAALAGGSAHSTDVLDFIFPVAAPTHSALHAVAR